MKKVLMVALGVSLVAAAFADFANGSFETGDFAGWTTQDASDGGSLYFVASSGVYNISSSDGAMLAIFGATGAENDVISQTLTTTAGANYVLSFDVGTNDNSVDNFEVSMNGTDLYNGNAPLVDPNSNMTYMTFNVVGTGSDTFAFGARNPPDYTGLDNVSLTPVPEPASLAVLGVGALALIRRRRNK